MGTASQPDLAQIRAELRQIISAAVDANLDDIDDETPLLDYVSSSLMLLAGIRAVYDRFGVLVPLRPLLEGAGNLRALSAFIEQALNAQGKIGRDAIGRRAVNRNKGRQIPLTAAQKHVGFHVRYSSGASAAFNESLALRLKGPLHGPAIQAAIEAVVERYEALQATLVEDNDAFTLASDNFELPIVHCVEEQLLERAGEIAARPFAVEEPLFRAELLRSNETDHLLVLAGHALVLDHAALMIVLEDIAEFYGVFTRGQDSQRVRPAIQLTAYMAEQDNGQPAEAEADDYWATMFPDGLPRLELPSDHRRPPIKTYDGARLAVPLPVDVQAKLHAWREPAHTMFGAFTAYLHRLAAQKDFVIGAHLTPHHLNGERRIVCTTGTVVPIRSRYEPYASFADHVRAATELLTDVAQNRRLPPGDALKVERDQSRAALFSAAFRTEAYDKLPEFYGLRCRAVTVPVSRARYDIELILASAQDGAELWCDYSTELFETETIACWMRGFIEFVRAGIDQPTQPCNLLPVMSQRETSAVLYDWNATAMPYPRDRTTLDLIADVARAEGNRIAIRWRDGDLTYAQLMASSSQIGLMLDKLGVARGDRVAVLLHRIPDLIATMLAIWHRGAAYLPLDPDVPKKRLAFMFDDAGARAVVTSHDLADLLDHQEGLRCVYIEDKGTGGPVPLPASRSSDIAYVIYTSGSTGQPKGVEITHRSLLNCLLGAQHTLGFSNSDCFLAITTPAFDISTVELFMPLVAGGTVELGEGGLAADGVRLSERIDVCKASHVQATPSTWKAVLAAGWRGSKDLCLVATGEALTRELAEQLLARARTVWNLYGPTETTVWAAAHLVISAPGEPVPIGRPWPNMQLHVLDDHLQPVPIGAVGELYIGGDGVARGYVGRPELTQERFIANPFATGARLYRTGDLARYLPNGDIVCLGRIDHQVKIHGYRVELEEIESCLRAIAGVRDGVVTTWVDASGERQLVAHVLTDETQLTASAIREVLRESLPDAMVPPYILLADRFSLTSSGKIDRAALPAPDSVRGADRAVAAPETATERKVAEIWARVLRLGASQIGRDDGFMNLGGHSLKMTELMVEVRKEFGVRFSLRDFFAASSVRSFAALIDELKRASASRNASYITTHARDLEWGKQRMLFLRREAELPANIVPARGLTFQARKPGTVLLTGATGFLGAYILAEMLRNTDADVCCLVRPKQGADSKTRIETQLRTYELWSDDDQWQAAWLDRVRVLEGDVILPRIGLADAVYEVLARDVDCIIHSAAHVNFIYPYEALKATNVLGLHEIVRFAFHARIKPVHYLSTAAIWPMGTEYTYFENDPLDHGKLLNLGYDEAKWVGERCLVNAAERGLPVARYRPGEVGGDSETGRSVLNHFLFALLKGCLQFGAVPTIDTHIDVAPVDYVAKAIVHMAFHGNPLGRAFHLTNPRACHMRDAILFLRKAGYRFDELPFEEIRQRLVESPGFADNALFPYQAALESMDDRSLQLPKYDCRQAQRELSGSGIICPPVDDRLLSTYLGYLRAVGFIPAPDELPEGPHRYGRVHAAGRTIPLSGHVTV